MPAGRRRSGASQPATEEEERAMDRFHVEAGGYLRWLVVDRERDDEVVAVERSYELAQDKAHELNHEAGGVEEPA
jgi:hypothetical protein